MFNHKILIKLIEKLALLIFISCSQNVFANSNPEEVNCQMFQVFDSGAEYSICVFVDDSSDHRRIKIFYTPVLLLVGSPKDTGIYYHKDTYSHESHASNVISFLILYDDKIVEQELRNYFDLKDNDVVQCITPKDFHVKVKIPGNDNWIENIPLNSDGDIIFASRVIRLGFQMDHKDVESLYENSKDGNIQFKITLEYYSKKEVAIRGEVLMKYIFADEYVDKLFRDRTAVYLTQYQLYNLFGRGNLALEAKILIEDQSMKMEYLELFFNWIASLKKEARIDKEYLAFINDGQLSEEELLNIGVNNSEMKKEHYLYEKYKKNPGSLNEMELKKLKKINLIKLEKSDLSILNKYVIDLTRYYNSISKITYTRSSPKDLVQAPEATGNINPQYITLPDYDGFNNVVISNKYQAFEGRISLLIEKNEIRIKNLKLSNELIINLSSNETCNGYMESKPENCLVLLASDNKYKTSSLYCIDYENLKLKYEIINYPSKNVEIAIRPKRIQVQDKYNEYDIYPVYVNLVSEYTQAYITPTDPGLLKVYLNNGSNKLLSIGR
ncbi:MAG: hypothetical protein ABIA04_05895 [Pseudomonadota bacterium]